MPDILIVDNDPDYSRQVASYLGHNGFVVHTAADPRAMNRTLSREPVTLVILDAHMPDGAGLATCRRLAEAGGPPVILTSSGQDEIERIIGLEIGADDYINKPVNPRELLARVRVAVRRNARAAGPVSAPSYANDGYELDVFRRQFRAAGGKALKLTPTETSIIAVFLERKGDPISRLELKSLVFRDDESVLDRAIDTQISRLRRKFVTSFGIDFIQTVYGVGYAWDAGYGRTVSPQDHHDAA